MKFITVLITFLFMASAYASKEIGNGGDVVVCPDQTVRVLDLYEGFALRGFKYEDPLAHENHFDYAKKILKRLQDKDFHRGKRYLAWLKEIEEDKDQNVMKIMPGINIPDIPDHGETVLPVGCSIEQIAFQKENPFEHDPRYVFKKELWDRLDTLNKAFIIVHEIVYREAIEHHHRNSISVRYFNSLIFSGLLSKYSPHKYEKLIQQIPFSHFSYAGFNFKVLDYDIDFFSNHTVRKRPPFLKILIQLKVFQDKSAPEVEMPI